MGRRMPTISVNGQAVARFDPVEFPGPTITDPRVTAREDNWQSPSRTKRGTRIRVRQVTPTYAPLTEAERNRRLYNRGW